MYVCNVNGPLELFNYVEEPRRVEVVDNQNEYIAGVVKWSFEPVSFTLPSLGIFGVVKSAGTTVSLSELSREN